MFNPLTDKLPDSYRGYKVNTSFRQAIKAMQIIESPLIRMMNDKSCELSSDEALQSLALLNEAIDCIFYDNLICSDDKLGFDGALQGVLWWLNCGLDDAVENYWVRERITPDIDDVSFSMDSFLSGTSDTVMITKQSAGDEAPELISVSRYSIFSFKAPDNTIRYKIINNAEPEKFSLYEDRFLVYSAFYKLFKVDLGTSDMHWFTFSYLLSEVMQSDNTFLGKKIEARSFDDSAMSAKEKKQQRKYVDGMNKRKNESRVLGIIPFNGERYD